MKKIKLWGFEKNIRLKSVPEGLYLVALALRARGYEVKIHLLPRDFVDDVKAKLPTLLTMSGRDYQRLFPSLSAYLPEAADPEVVFHGIQTYEGDLNYIAVLVSFLRAVSGALVVGGGPLATLAPREALEVTGVDLALRGECEESAPLLADLVAKRHIRRDNLAAHLPELQKVPGIALPVSSREFYLSPEVPFPQPLPYLPEDVEFWQESRRAAFPGAASGPCTYPISASRGCPRRCVFCSHANGRRHRRYRFPEIAARLIALTEGIARLQASGELGRVYLSFGDDDFFCTREYALKLLRFFREQRLARVMDIVICGSIPSLVVRGRVDEELLEAIKLSEVVLLQLGTDAFCDEEIRHLKGGGYTTADIHALVHALEERQIRNHHFWILSGPRTTLRSLLHHLLQAYHLQVTYRYFFVLWPNFYLMPLVGSPLRRDCDRAQHWTVVEKKILTCRRDGEPGEPRFRFYERVLPQDPRAAALLARLEAQITPCLEGRVPYGFDFPAALSLARKYLREELSRRPDREVEACLGLLEEVTGKEEAA